MQYVEVEEILEAIDELGLSKKANKALEEKAMRGLKVEPYTLHALRALKAIPFLLEKVRAKTTATYTDLGKYLECYPRTLSYTLGVFQNACFHKGWPHITSLILNKQTGVCGAGFGGCDETKRTPRQERKAVYEFEWKVEELVEAILDLPA